MRDKSNVPGTAPAFNVSGKLRALPDLARRRLLFARGGQPLIEHLPENGFILKCKLTNHVIHDSNDGALLPMVADYGRNTKRNSFCNIRVVILPQSATIKNAIGSRLCSWHT